MKKTLIILLLISNSISAQSNLDLLKYDPEKIYTQRFIDSLRYDRASGEAKGKVNLDEFKKILDHNPDLRGWIYYYGKRAHTSFNEQKLDSTLYFANKGIDYYDQLEIKRPLDEHLSAVCYRLKGTALEWSKLYEPAIKNYQKALDLSKVYPYKWKTFITSGIANCHLGTGNDSIALQYYLKCTNDSLYMSLDRPAITTYSRIGVLYAYFNEHENAKKYYRRAIKLSQASQYKSNLGGLYGNIGSLYREDGNIDSTIYYYKQSIQNYDTLVSNPKAGYGHKQTLKAYIDLHSNRIDRGIEQLKKVIHSYQDEEIINIEDKEIIMSTYVTLAEAYTRKNDINNLNKSIIESNTFIENFYKDLLKKNTNDLEVKYKAKEKDNSIARLEKITQSQEVIIKQRNTIGLILGGLFFSILAVGVLFYRQRLLKNKYLASNLEQRLLRSQLNPHFLFNALNSVSHLVQKKSEKTIPYISKLSNLLRSILENTREEFISLEEELEIITIYLELQSNFSKKFQYDIQVSEYIDKEAVLIPPMFIQPFIENSIEHGFQDQENNTIKIVINLDKTDKILHFEIKDNGIGYSKSIGVKNDKSGHRSLSGQILQERLSFYAKTYKSKAFYLIEDLDVGTKVSLHLPYIPDI